MPHESYPYLSQLLGSWFHQDFDIDGETLEEILARYKAVSSVAETRATKADIKKFIEQSGNHLDTDFIKIFHPDVDPKGWGMTTKEWLMRIHDLL